MDDTDFQIVAHLFRAPLAGIQDIARAVGLTRNSASRRLQQLTEGGLRLRFYAIPHHSLLGRSSTVNLYATTGKVDLEALCRLPDVMGYDVNHDGLCVVTLWQRPGSARPSGLDAMMGGKPLSTYSDATPGPNVPHLSSIEWKTAIALLAQPRASAAQLARKTGLSARTCSSARDRLIRSAAIQVRIGFLEDEAGGMPIFRAYVHGQPTEASVRAILGKEAVITDTVQEGTVWFAKANTVGGIMANVEALRRLPHVDDVKLILSRESGIAQENLHGWCTDAMQASRTARR